MAEEHTNKSLREYASFDAERRGYDRAQVDAFLSELDQAFIELETAVKERGTEIAALQKEVERLRRESPAQRADEILRRAEENAEQMLATSLAEGQEIIANAETVAMRIIANAREQSEELANQPPGFGMLARVRTIAADIDRIKAEHAALMEEEPDDELDAVADRVVAGPEAAEAPTTDDAPEPAPAETDKPAAKKTAAKKPAAKKTTATKTTAKKPATRKPAAKKSTAKKPAAKKPAASTEKAAAEEKAGPEEPAEPPRVQLVEPEPAAPDDDEMVDAKNFDWSAAREQVLTVRDDEPLVDELKRGEAPEADGRADVDDEEEAADEPDVPTIIRREGSRYERHSASLPKLGDDAGAALSDVSKVSRRRRKRAPVRDEEPA